MNTETIFRATTITDYLILEILYRADFSNNMAIPECDVVDGDTILESVSTQLTSNKKYKILFNEMDMETFIEYRLNQLILDSCIVECSDIYQITREGRREFRILHGQKRFMDKQDELEEDQNRALESITSMFSGGGATAPPGFPMFMNFKDSHFNVTEDKEPSKPQDD